MNVYLELRGEKREISSFLGGAAVNGDEVLQFGERMGGGAGF